MENWKATDGHKNGRLRHTERVSQQDNMCFFWSSMRVVGHRSQSQLYHWHGLNIYRMYSVIDVGCCGGCSASFDLCLRFSKKSPGCTAQSDSCVTASNIESTGLGFHTCTLKSWLSLTVSELSLSEGLQMSQRRAFHLTRGQRTVGMCHSSQPTSDASRHTVSSQGIFCILIPPAAMHVVCIVAVIPCPYIVWQELIPSAFPVHSLMSHARSIPAQVAVSPSQI